MRVEYEKYSVLILDLDGTLIETIQGNPFPKGVHERRFKAKILYVAATLEDYLKSKYNREVEVDVRYCPSNEPCDMRKPYTGMLTNSFVGLVPKDSILFIGDATDKKCAENFGVGYRDVRDFIEDYNKIK